MSILKLKKRSLPHISKESKRTSRSNDEFAKEAQESSEDIAKYKKLVNEAQTESELLIKYYQSLFNSQL